MEIVAGMYKKGYTVGDVAKKTGLTEESVMYIWMDYMNGKEEEGEE